jgi:hypothetical protein
MRWLDGVKAEAGKILGPAGQQEAGMSRKAAARRRGTRAQRWSCSGARVTVPAAALPLPPPPSLAGSTPFSSLPQPLIKVTAPPAAAVAVTRRENLLVAAA